MMHFQGPPRAEALNHTPIRQVNNLLAELIDGKDHEVKSLLVYGIQLAHQTKPIPLVNLQ
jgi:hypothetical protein